MRFKDWLEEYQMNHRPPDGEFGAPLHDLTKIYILAARKPSPL